MRPVLIVLFDGVQSLDVTGPLEVFSGARDDRSRRAYRVRTASLGGAPVRTSSGLVMEVPVTEVPVTEVPVRRDDEPARGADRRSAEARGAYPVGATAPVVPGAGEDLKRSGDVEGLHPVEQDDQNWSHAFQSGGAHSWQQ